jgi:aconitate hydratase
LKGKESKEFRFTNPYVKELPPWSCNPGQNTYQFPPADHQSVNVAVSPLSDWLQVFKPFNAWEGKDP